MSSDAQPPRPAMIPFVASGESTIRASQAYVSLDGGAFVLMLVERRPLTLTNGQFEVGDHEVGRYILPPTALHHLREQLERAMNAYKSTFGVEAPAPASLPVDAMDAAKRSLLENLSTSPEEPEP